jgi:hypothetical protein
MGHAVYNKLELGVSMEEIDTLLQSHKWVGPTISKMFLVSTHFFKPELRLLNGGCEVGVGAQEAFKIIFPGIQRAKDYSALANRREVLGELLALFVGDGAGGEGGDGAGDAGGGAGGNAGKSDHISMSSLEPRLLPMIDWVAQQARIRFGSIPNEAIETEMSASSLQVQLCEWRKFRNNTDKKKQARRGMGCGGGTGVRAAVE